MNNFKNWPVPTIIATVLCAILLVACSADDQGSQSEDTLSPTERKFTEADIAAMQEFSDTDLDKLSETNLACEALDHDDVTRIFGGNWTEGRFNWFESELQRAASALRGICVFTNTDHMTTVTLRIYEASDLAWEINRQDDEAFSRRFAKRDLSPATDINERAAYRKPMSSDAYDLTCASIGEYIVCLSASARHTDDWTNKDRAVLKTVVRNLARHES